MVDLYKITAKFEMLEQFLEILQGLSQKKIGDYLSDPVIIGSVRYYLQVSIECCLDVASHVISSERYRAPKDYADTFKVLEEEKIIPSILSNKLRQMAKFRNRLVHLYGEIDDRAVFNIARSDLTDIMEFKKIILKKFAG